MAQLLVHFIQVNEANGSGIVTLDLNTVQQTSPVQPVLKKEVPQDASYWSSSFMFIGTAKFTKTDLVI